MLYAIDFETTGLDYFKDNILGMGYYSPTEKGYLNDLSAIVAFFEQHRTDQFALHNGKFDQQFFFHHTGWWFYADFDTLLGASLDPLRPPRLKLQNIATHYANYHVWKEEDYAENLKDKPYEEQKAYCLQDCKATYDTAIVEMQRLQELGQDRFFREYYIPIANMCSRVEYNGFLVDRDKLVANQSQLIGTICDKKEELYLKYSEAMSKFENEKSAEHLVKNPNTKRTGEQLRKKYRFKFTPQQKIWLLDYYGFKTTHVVREKGENVKKQTCSKKLLDTIKTENPLIQELISLQDCITQESYITQYLEAIKTDGRIHSSINLSVTDTGRLSSSSPNLQNVSPENKSSFICQPGSKLVVMDLTAIEPCFMAYYSQDRALLETFQSGRDLYALVANLLLKLNLAPLNHTKAFMKDKYPKERIFGKTTALAIAYGRGPKRLAEDIKNQSGIECSYPDALKYIDSYWKGFPQLDSFRYTLGQFVLKYGYLENIFGRRTFLSKDNAEHLALNYLLQGTASDFNSIFQLWLGSYCEQYSIPYKLVMLVHDEAIYEVEKKYVDKLQWLIIDLIKNCFQRYMPQLKFNVPLGCEIFIGDNWGCKK